MKKILLNLYCWPAFLLVTLLGLALVPAILLGGRLLHGRGVATTMRRAIRVYGWVLVRLVPFFAPVRLHIPAAGLPTPAIFVANHNSAIDPYLFGTIAVENSFVTSWPFRIPVYNFFMRLAGYANADGGWPEIAGKGRQLLAAGSSLIIWPEGHRSRDGRLARFKNGAFRLAVETGRPVIPVCIIGSGQVLPPGQRLLNPARISLHILAPLYPEGEGEEAVRRLREEAWKGIEGCLRQRGHFADLGQPRRAGLHGAAICPARRCPSGGKE